MKKATIYTFIMLLVGVMSYAQDCKVPQSVKDGQFDFIIPKDKLMNGKSREGFLNYNKTDSQTIFVKTPANLKEIKDRKDIIECDGITFLPGSAAIDEIRVKSVTNLPPGVGYKIQKVMKGGSEYCLVLSGLSTKKGVYDVKIELEGDGKLMGIKRTVDCRMNQFKIHIF